MTAHSDALTDNAPAQASALLQQPRWRKVVVALAALLTMGATVSMGVWQWGRAQEKLALEAALQSRASLQVLDAHALQPHPAQIPENWLHRKVSLQGQWLHAHTLYLDNRQMQGRVGFFVLTPLQLPSGQVVAVQRGWVPRDFQQRERLPLVPAPTGTVTVQGQLQAAPARLWEPDAQSAASGPIRQNVDLSAWRAASGLPLAGYVVREDGAGAAGTSAKDNSEGTAEGRTPLLREWPAPASDVHKHYGYAAQWFAMAALVAGLFLWLQVLRPLRSRQPTHRQRERDQT